MGSSHQQAVEALQGSASQLQVAGVVASASQLQAAGVVPSASLLLAVASDSLQLAAVGLLCSLAMAMALGSLLQAAGVRLASRLQVVARRSASKPHRLPLARLHRHLASHRLAAVCLSGSSSSLVARQVLLEALGSHSSSSSRLQHLAYSLLWSRVALQWVPISRAGRAVMGIGGKSRPGGMESKRQLQPAHSWRAAALLCAGALESLICHALDWCLHADYSTE